MLRGVVALLAALLLALPARADEAKLKIGYSLISEFMAAYVAADHGIFAKHGITPELVAITNSANLPASVASGSVAVGAVNVATLLHAVDGGVGLVVIAGASMIPNHNAPIAFVTAPGWSYTTPHGIEGKSVAMPGIGSAVDVLFRNWAKDQGDDLEHIRIVEVPLPQIPDSLRTHSVDSAILVEPFLTRALAAGQAKMGVRFTDTLKQPVIATMYAVDTTWAKSNGPTIAAFRASIAEGVDYAKAHPQEAREALGHYIKLPPAVVATLPFPMLTPTVSVEQMAWWVDQMRAEGFLQTAISPAATLQP